MNENNILVFRYYYPDKLDVVLLFIFVKYDSFIIIYYVILQYGMTK